MFQAGEQMSKDNRVICWVVAAIVAFIGGLLVNWFACVLGIVCVWLFIKASQEYWEE